MASSPQFDWDLHLLRVVIDDGYPERHVGDVFNWVLAFWTEVELLQSSERIKTAIPIGNGYYRVNAEITYISQDAQQASCILDFGISAISESGGLLGIPLPPECQEGDYVTGEIRLELPLCTDVHPYNLGYQLHVHRVSADLTDFSMYQGDISEVRYKQVDGTDLIKAGNYVLHCSVFKSEQS